MSISKNYRIAEKALAFMYSKYVIAKNPKIETSQTVQKCVSDIRQTPRFAIFTIMQALDIKIVTIEYCFALDTKFYRKLYSKYDIAKDILNNDNCQM